MSAALYFAGMALFAVAGAFALAVIGREFRIYADRAIDALLMGDRP